MLDALFHHAMRAVCPQAQGSECSLRKRDGAARSFTLRLCRSDEAEAIMALQLSVLAALEAPALFALTDGEELAEELSEDVVIGAFDGEAPVACAILVRNRYTPHNIAHYLGYTPEQCARCATLSTVLWRGTAGDSACSGF